MDANGTRFHMLLGEDDWSRCTGEDGHLPVFSAPATASPPDAAPLLHWDSDRHELLLHPRLFTFVSSPADSLPTLTRRRGAGCDRFGNWFWIDESEQTILVNSSGTQLTAPFWPLSDTTGCLRMEDAAAFKPVLNATPAAPLRLCGLAVTDDHYLVVGTVAPAGILIFDLYGGGAPQRIEWSAPFSPFDMAPRSGGGVLILDRDNKKVWVLDRDLHVCSVECTDRSGEQEDFFQPMGGAVRRVMPKEMSHTGIPLLEGALATDIDPIAIEALPDGSMLILSRSGGAESSRISRYSVNGEQKGQAQLTEQEGACVCTVIGHDFAFVPAEAGPEATSYGQLFVADREGNQVLAFALTYTPAGLSIRAVSDYLPMRLFGGKGLVRSGTQVFYDFSTSWIPLVRQNRPRYQENATLITPRFDGREPDCVWHRLLLDASLPPETGVTIWSRASNQLSELSSLAWQREPTPYRRGNGSEVPFVQAAAGSDTWDSLFQSARGRYLQLKISVFGNGSATPRLRSLRAYYPRFSYLAHYLPALYRGDSLSDNYQEERLSASFLDRFLANLEGMHTALEDRIAAAQILLDPECAPVEVLDWLSGWFGISLDPSWDERRQRLFLQHAMDFFSARGTIRGLQMALRLALDECADESMFTDRSLKSMQQSPIRIVEQFRTRRTPGIVFGDPTGLEAGPTLVTPVQRWTPEQTGEELHRRYTGFLAVRTSVSHDPKFPITVPVAAGEAVLWRSFSQSTLGFVPSFSANSLPAWQNFLARRYRTITEYNNQNKTKWPSFDAVLFPTSLPTGGSLLRDWYQFESVVLPMRRTAHRFTVLLPTPKTGTADSAEYQRRLQLARRIIALEKPAHTTFSVNFYWAMFRVGEARVGYDTVVDQGSRAPEFMAAMVLGKQHVGESLIGSLRPPLQDRFTLGETGLK
ncbi:MAG: phage tail protein [Desulfuromonadaceae bacterium]|nr:phage tail protein [Desulfuromonadaceae bacterium]